MSESLNERLRRLGIRKLAEIKASRRLAAMPKPAEEKAEFRLPDVQDNRIEGWTVGKLGAPEPRFAEDDTRIDSRGRVIEPPEIAAARDRITAAEAELADARSALRRAQRGG
jgi:hypothetical protein